jgi:hypothetical protein
MHPNAAPLTSADHHPTWDERRGWLLFAEAKFPNYQRFWQTFVVPRTKHAKYYTVDLNILANVPEQERRIIELNYYIFTDLYAVYRSFEKKRGTPSKERSDFRISLSQLAAACDRTDLLLFMFLRITNELPVSDPVRQAYDHRIANHKAAVEVANAPYKDQLIGMDNEPPRIPRIPALIPSELTAIREHCDLTAFDTIAGRIRHHKEAITALRAASPKYWRKEYDKHIAPSIKPEDESAEQARVAANETAIRAILGDHATMRGLTKELADSLTAELNIIWGQQVLILLEECPQTPIKQPTISV